MEYYKIKIIHRKMNFQKNLFRIPNCYQQMGIQMSYIIINKNN